VSEPASSGWLGGAVAAGLGVGLALGFPIFLAWGLLSIQVYEYQYFGYTWTNFIAIMVWSVALCTAFFVIKSGVTHRRAVEAADHSRRLAQDEARRREREDEVRARDAARRRLESSAVAARQEYLSLPSALRQAGDFRDEALAHFRSGAFSPFWAAVEAGFVALGDYNASIHSIQEHAARYARSAEEYRLHGGTGAVPPFPVDVPAADATAVAEMVASALRAVAYDAQKNPTYAQIWEQRRTTAVLVQGFRSMEQAIGGLHLAIQESAQSLAREVRAVGRVVASSGGGVERQLTAASAVSTADSERLNATLKDAVWLLDDQRKRALGWR